MAPTHRVFVAYKVNDTGTFSCVKHILWFAEVPLIVQELQLVYYLVLYAGQYFAWPILSYCDMSDNTSMPSIAEHECCFLPYTGLEESCSAGTAEN